MTIHSLKHLAFAVNSHEYKMTETGSDYDPDFSHTGKIIV